MLAPKSKNLLRRPKSKNLLRRPDSLDFSLVPLITCNFGLMLLAESGAPCLLIFATISGLPLSHRERGFIFWRTKLLSIKRRRWPPLRFYGPREGERGRSVFVHIYCATAVMVTGWAAAAARMGTGERAFQRERRISSRSHFFGRCSPPLLCCSSSLFPLPFTGCESDNADIFFAPLPAKN